MVSFDTKSYSKKLLSLIGWGHWFTFFNIIAAIALSSFYLISDSAPETLLGQVYLITTWLSHIGFLTFISFVLILFPITLIYPNTKFIRGISSVIFAAILILLLIDAFIYSKLGYHLTDSSSVKVLSLIKEVIEHEGSTFYLVTALCALFIITYEFVVSNYAWKHLRQLQKTIFARFVVLGLVISFFFSHLTHIWADANLKYDVLRQDTIFPLSYPATAKTLLTKYDLFNIDDYNTRRNIPLSFTKAVGRYPTLSGQCPNRASLTSKQSVFIVLTDLQLTKKQFNHLKRRAQSSSLLQYNTDASLTNDAWFNLFYSLPNIYQEDIVSQQVKPLLFQAIEKEKLTSTFTVISADDNFEVENNSITPTSPLNPNAPQWASSLFDEKTKLDNISSLVFANKLNNKSQGLHLVYFQGIKDKRNAKEEQNTLYQFELFVDALLLAQQHKSIKDIIWISSIGNLDKETRLSSKPALLVTPTISSNSSIDELTSLMDLQPTLFKHWLGCDESLFTNGADILNLKENRTLSNTTPDGMIVFDKDKSALVDQHGNFQSYSSQFNAPITINSDFSLMIDGVHFINKFRQANQR
jgi:hypothetical protein